MAKDAKNNEIKIGDYVVYNYKKETTLNFGYIIRINGMKVQINENKDADIDDFWNRGKYDKSTLIVNHLVKEN